MEEKSKQKDAEEIMPVFDALVADFDVPDNTDAINRRPTLRVLSQDIADLADRVQALAAQYRK